MGNLTKFEDLEIPALTLVAQEQYEECLWAIEKALAKQLEFGRVLLIVKAKLPHGEWGSWVRETFADHKSLRTIQRHMRGAEAIATDPSLLECADSLDGILKIVEDRKPSVEVIEVAATASIELAGKDTDQMLDETTAAYGTGEDINVVVEPSTTPGYAYLSILVGTKCVWLKRPIHRNAIPELIKGEIPADARLTWEFAENAGRVDRALFSLQ
jgi:hypothetical protein